MEGSSLADVYGDMGGGDGGGGGGSSSPNSSEATDPRGSPLTDAELQAQKSGMAHHYMPPGSMSCTSRGDATTMGMMDQNAPSERRTEGGPLFLHDVVAGQREQPIMSRMEHPTYRQTTPTPPPPSAAPPPPTHSQQPPTQQQQYTLTQIMQTIAEVLHRSERVVFYHADGNSIWTKSTPDAYIIQSDRFGAQWEIPLQDQDAMVLQMILSSAPLNALDGIQLGSLAYVNGTMIMAPNNEAQIWQDALIRYGLTQDAVAQRAGRNDGGTSFWKTKTFWIIVSIIVCIGVLLSGVALWKLRRRIFSPSNGNGYNPYMQSMAPAPVPMQYSHHVE